MFSLFFPSLGLRRPTQSISTPPPFPCLLDFGSLNVNPWQGYLYIILMCAVEVSQWTESWLPNKEWSEAGYPSSLVLCSSPPQDGWGIIRQRSSAILHRNGQVGGTHQSSRDRAPSDTAGALGTEGPVLVFEDRPCHPLPISSVGIWGGSLPAFLRPALLLTPPLIYLRQEIVTKEKMDREGENKNVPNHKRSWKLG